MLRQLFHRTLLKYRFAKIQGPQYKYKSVCAGSVCRYLGVFDEVKYLQTSVDIVNALCSGGYRVLSKFEDMGKGFTVHGLRDIVADMDHLYKGYFVVVVENHVLLLHYAGRVLVDTMPTPGIDTRKIVDLFLVFK